MLPARVSFTPRRSLHSLPPRLRSAENRTTRIRVYKLFTQIVFSLVSSSGWVYAAREGGKIVYYSKSQCTVSLQEDVSDTTRGTVNRISGAC